MMKTSADLMQEALGQIEEKMGIQKTEWCATCFERDLLTWGEGAKILWMGPAEAEIHRNANKDHEVKKIDEGGGEAA